MNEDQPSSYPETMAIHNGVYKDEHYHSISTPIYQTSTFYAESLAAHSPYSYARFGNPTSKALEENINALEGGAGALATVSGNAAIFLVCLLLKKGEHLICSSAVHGGTMAIIEKVLARFGVEYSFVDLTDITALKKAIRLNTKLIWIETPSNPLLDVIDLKAVVQQARYAEALTVVDNTLMTPLWQQPFNFGIDLVVHSTTKYLNGHSDALGGAVVARTPELFNELSELSSLLGIGGHAFESWLILRGIKTLPYRLRAHEENASAIAQSLLSSPYINKIFYPGLATHPGHELAKKQQKSFGAIVCFEVNLEQIDLNQFFQSLKIFKLAYSLGGVESIISHPWSKSHSCLTERARLKAGITPSLVRLSVGIENKQDLIKDLQVALNNAAKDKVTVL